ncbi:MAG: hypothetical protein NTX58_06750 [Actinobacteria bacterium]|nr:hypothetical protein [Actinomycetota bacterium]
MAQVEPSHPDPQPSDPDTALPSVLARALAFGSIFIGAAAGGLIGYAFAELGRFGGAYLGFITFISMLLGAGGVAVVAVLTLRAFGEWDTIQQREQQSESN